MKRRKQYRWITAVFSLILIAAIVVGAYTAKYCYNRKNLVGDDLSLILNSYPEFFSAEQSYDYFEEPVIDLSETLITVYLGNTLAESYDTSYDDSGLYEELVDIYSEAEERLDSLKNYKWAYYVTSSTFLNRNSISKGASQYYNDFIDSAWGSDYTVFFQNDIDGQVLYLSGYYEISDLSYGSSTMTNYTINTAYDDYLEDIYALIEQLHGYDSEIVGDPGSEARLEMLESLEKIVDYIENPNDYKLAFVLYDWDMEAFNEANGFYNDYYTMVYELFQYFFVMAVAISVAFISLLILVLNITGILRRFFKFSSRCMRRIPFEIKVMIWIGALLIGIILVDTSYMYTWMEVLKTRALIILNLGILSCFLIGGVLISDLYYNKMVLLKNSFTIRVRRFIERYQLSLPFIKRLYMWLVGFVLICVGAFGLILLGYSKYNIIFMFVGVILAAIALTLFGNKMGMFVRDLDVTAKKLEDIVSGNMNNNLEVKESSDLKKMVDQLDSLKDTIEGEVQERLKSERLKVELVTNVSHDIKTPLTSIINYIKLLEDENLKPEEANDYVKVLRNKADRLKSLTEDLFDVAKASSGEMNLVMEVIELSELVGQSLAENQRKIEESGLHFRVSVPNKVYIMADGQRIYRVIENIIINAIKYSMFGTRVYIDIEESNEVASITVKNIANYEMDFNPNEITDRFVRGDEARSTDGSGLGLSIVTSFVELMGGIFQVEIDGDLFKAIIKFPSVEK